MQTWLTWLFPVALLAASLSISRPLHAAGDPISDAQLQAAIIQAVQINHPSGADQSAVKIKSRNDLDADFTRVSQKAKNISFYEATSPSATSLGADDSVWAVVSGNSPQEPYGLYDFESSADLAQSSQEFNRLVSQLSLSVTENQAASVAQFFMDCCVLGTPADVVGDEDTLHHSIEREYMQIYGEDVWRALSAFTEWWQGYTESAYQFPPAAQTESGGDYRASVERVVAGFGMHPQLQECDLQISRDGKVRITSVESIFPKEARWLSYDSRTNVPGFHGPKEELERLKALITHSGQ